MEDMQWSTIDKSTWGEGPWQAEPDKVQWVDQATGLPCLAVRNPHTGVWCGYVGVSPDHKWYGVDYYPYFDLDADDSPSLYMNVHGGLTYAGHCSPGTDPSTGICHVTEGEDHVWWFGFDCAHCDDFSPAYAAKGYPFTQASGETYRTLEYVKDECGRLAKQLKEAR